MERSECTQHGYQTSWPEHKYLHKLGSVKNILRSLKIIPIYSNRLWPMMKAGVHYFDSLTQESLTRKLTTSIKTKTVWHRLLLEKSCSLFSLITKESFFNISYLGKKDASALRLVRCAFANLLIDEWVKEQECYTSSTLLSVFLGERK